VGFSDARQYRTPQGLYTLTWESEAAPHWGGSVLTSVRVWHEIDGLILRVTMEPDADPVTVFPRRRPDLRPLLSLMGDDLAALTPLRGAVRLALDHAADMTPPPLLYLIDARRF